MNAINAIIDVVETNEFNVDQLFFLDESEDTNKIFVQNIVMIKLRFEERIVLVVTSFDIAATLLNDDQTAHSRFKISLDFESNSLCNIKKTNHLIELIREIDLIF